MYIIIYNVYTKLLLVFEIFLINYINNLILPKMYILLLIKKKWKKVIFFFVLKKWYKTINEQINKQINK